MRLTLEDPQGRLTVTVDLAALFGLELPRIDLGSLVGGLAATAPADRQSARTEEKRIDGEAVTMVYETGAARPCGAVWPVVSVYDRHQSQGRPWAANRNGRPFPSYHHTKQEAIEAVLRP